MYVLNCIQDRGGGGAGGSWGGRGGFQGRKRNFEEMQAGGGEEDSEDENDEVKLHQEGWKDRYYSTKFHVPASDVKFRKTLVSFEEDVYKGVASA